jgi:6-phosphogluconolactonase/glucosamine-6-phosphate isomerase/deaminase
MLTGGMYRQVGSREKSRRRVQFMFGDDRMGTMSDDRSDRREMKVTLGGGMLIPERMIDMKKRDGMEVKDDDDDGRNARDASDVCKPNR